MEEREVGPPPRLPRPPRSRLLGGPRVQRHRGPVDRRSVFVGGKPLTREPPSVRAVAEEQPRRMGIFRHLEELRQRLKWSILAVFFLFVFFAAFRIQTADVGGVTVPYPWPDPLQPAASQFFNLTLNYLVPPDVTPVVLGPTDAFVVQLQSALFLALVSGMPIVAYHMGKFIAPALYERERKVIVRLVVPAVFLFVAGILLAFFVLLPFTFRFLYSIAGSLGARQKFLSLDQFIGFTLVFTFGFAATFELPIVMYALTAATLVKASTWRKYWRFAVIAIFFFAALITPG